MNRINEISFNSSLFREIRAIAFVTRLIDEKKITDGSLKRMLIHAIEADDVMQGLGPASKLNADWELVARGLPRPDRDRIDDRYPGQIPVNNGLRKTDVRCEAEAHNLKVRGSNPLAATKLRRQIKDLAALPSLRSRSNRAQEALWKQEGDVIAGKTEGWRAMAYLRNWIAMEFGASYRTTRFTSLK